MSKFRKKPVVIEAFQLTYGVAKGREKAPEWFVKKANENKEIKVFLFLSNSYEV